MYLAVEVKLITFLTLVLGGGGGHVVAYLVEILRYKPEGRGLDSHWGHGDFSLT